jgi:hypothetical protein
MIGVKNITLYPNFLVDFDASKKYETSDNQDRRLLRQEPDQHD